MVSISTEPIDIPKIGADRNSSLCKSSLSTINHYPSSTYHLLDQYWLSQSNCLGFTGLSLKHLGIRRRAGQVCHQLLEGESRCIAIESIALYSPLRLPQQHLEYSLLLEDITKDMEPCLYI